MNDILDEIIGYLKDDMSARIKSFYKGEVVLPPKAYLPAIMVFGNSTNVSAKSTAKDQYISDITIRVVLDIRTKFKEDGTGETIQGYEDIVNIMEERETTGVLKTDTVLGVLRANIRGTNYLFNNDITAEYGKLDKGDFFYYTADINLTATTNLKLRP